jgi:hypothetical protein
LLSVTFFFYPVYLSLFGAGLSLASYRPRWADSKVLQMAALLGLAALTFCSLYLPVSARSSALLAGGSLLFLFLTPTYFFLGMQFSSVFRTPGKSMYSAVGVKIIAQACGYLFSLLMITPWGAYGLIAFIAYLMAVRGLPLATRLALAALLAVLPWNQWDQWLTATRLRNVSPVLVSADHAAGGANAEEMDCTTFPSVWSYRGLFTPCAHKTKRDSFVILFDDIPAYKQGRTPNPRFRAYIHSLFKPDQNIAIIGVGGARSLNDIPQEILSPNLFAIERNPSAVEFAKTHGNADLSKVTYLVEDGRGFLERSRKNFDWIFFEGAVDQASTGNPSVLAPFSLLTRESIATALNRLTPDGVFIFETTRVHSRTRLAFHSVVREFFDQKILPSFHFSAFRASNLEDTGGSAIQKHAQRNQFKYQRFFAKKYGGPADNGYILASRNKAMIDKIAGDSRNMWDKWTGSDVEEELPDGCSRVLADDNPFLTWPCSSTAGTFRYFLYAGLVSGLLIGWILILRIGQRDFLLRFSSFGLFGPLFFIANAYTLRTYFQDEIISFYMLMVFSYIIYGAVGVLFERHREWMMNVSRRTWIIALILLWHWLVLMGLPFSQPLWIRAAYFALGFTPAFALFAIHYYSLLAESASTARLPIQKTLAFELGLLLLSYSILGLSLLDFGIKATFLAAVFFLLLKQVKWGPSVWI